MSRTIEIVVSPSGQTTVQTQGYTGNACLAASTFLEQALGVSVSDRKTPEFHLNQTTEQTLPQRL